MVSVKEIGTVVADLGASNVLKAEAKLRGFRVFLNA
jgi:hypothetical protein